MAQSCRVTPNYSELTTDGHVGNTSLASEQQQNISTSANYCCLLHFTAHSWYHDYDESKGT